MLSGERLRYKQYLYLSYYIIFAHKFIVHDIMKINKSYLTHGYTCCYLSLNSIITNTFMHGMVRTTKSCLPITRKIGIFGNGSSIIGLIIKLISSDLNMVEYC